jgi:hypothetical protein
MRVISNFVENSRRYSQAKVHHCTGINDNGVNIVTGSKFVVGVN